MLSNFFKIALRNIIKHKGISFLNILGLAIGIACSILITVFVMHELSYDKYYEKSDRIYRIAVRASIGDTKIHQTYSSAITFLRLLEEFPEIETGVKFLNLGQIPISFGEQTFFEERFFAVDSTFYDVFSIPLIKGNSSNILAEPYTIVLTESTAIKYFGKTDVIGEIMKVDFRQYGESISDFKVTGVSEDMPVNSHFHYDLLVSSTSFPEQINSTGWTNNNFISYVVLKEGTLRTGLDEKLPEFTRKYMGGEDFDDWVAQGNYWEYFLQPVTEIHLNSDLNGEFETNGNETYVYILSIISIIILLIACINFMNLSTAKASLRAKEVGIRKVVGSTRSKLIQQFLGESVVMSLLALLLAIVIVFSLMPAYQNLLGKEIDLRLFENPTIIAVLLSLGLIVGIVSGSYPAFFLSSFKPVIVLKGNVDDNKKGSWLRNILVIFQFTISIFLIIGTFTIYNQMKLFQNKKLGFEKEQVMIIMNPGSVNDNIDVFKETLLTHHTISDISGSNTLPGKSFSNWGFGAEGVEKNFTLNACICDYDFLKTLQMELDQGRFFSRDFPSDSCAAILNESAVKLLGWENPIGKKINNWATNRGNFTVIGVIKDYHYESLHQEIRPMALFLIGGYFQRTQGYISARLKTENITETVDFVESTWEEFAENMPFEYSFLDEDYENLYINERQTRKLFTIFSILAIFIACLGLFGLASFTAERKTREIGIRKVFGASVPGIVVLLNRNFAIWVLLASLLACPAAWFVMKKWLENFAYRTTISWWMYISAAALALIIAWLVVTYQTYRAALRNPAESLKYE